MKRFITVIACAVLLAVATAPSHAQTTASANVTVFVESALEVVNLPGVLNLDFGSVLPGASESITHGSGVDFQILGADNANVVVSFTAPTQLTGPGGSIAFTPDFQGSSSNDPASANPVANGGTRALNGDGHHFLWLGGSITVGNILPGIYDAAFTVSVAY